MAKLFVAYPSDPADLKTTIERAKTEAQAGEAPGVEMVTWRRDDLGGQSVIAPIIEAITASEIVVADITSLNFNVTYELGYAIGLGKRGLPVINSAFASNPDERA